MNYYKTIEFCPAINFLKYSQAGTVQYLLKDIDFENLPDIDEKLYDELVVVGRDMEMAVVDLELSEVGKNQVIYSTKKSIAEKQIAYHQVINICNYINTFGVDEFSNKELRRYGYQVPCGCEDVPAHLRKIIANNENKRLFIAEEETELKTIAGEDKKTEYQKISLLIEKHLNRDIDLHKISMQKFILLKIDTIKAIEKWHQSKK